MNNIYIQPEVQSKISEIMQELVWFRKEYKVTEWNEKDSCLLVDKFSFFVSRRRGISNRVSRLFEKTKKE
jgi:hypothetical protein